MSNKIMLTGATGFLGSALLAALPLSRLTCFGRSEPELDFGKTVSNVIGALTPNADYSFALKDVEVVIHAAARAHVMDDKAADPLTAYREVNTLATLALAKQAAAAGIKRFIFISSVKVNGEATLPDKPYSPFDKANALDSYGISKAEAEQALQELAADTGMELVIIRPPLVYGPGVKANFAAMLKLAKKNLPLPLGAIHNKRSLVSLDNLVDLIITCIDHPKAANQIFLVSDDADVSTTELLTMMTRAFGKTPRLLPIPISWLKLAGKLTGKRAVIERLCGNLQVDITHTKETLDWKPPFSLEEGIRRCLTASS